MNIYEMIGRGVVFCGTPITFILILSAFATARKKEAKKIHDSTPLKYNGRYPLTVLLVLLCFGLKAQSDSIPCGYNYFNDTTATNIDSTCTLTTTTTTEKYPCYTGWGFWRRKSVCTRAVTSTRNVCTYDTSFIWHLDSTVKMCLDTSHPVYNVKNHLSGCAIRQQNFFTSVNPDTAFLNAIGGNIVLRINLNAIWIAEDSFDFAPIDTWLTFAEGLEAEGVPIHYKLRIISGTFAPTWLLNAAGGFPIDSTGFTTLPGSAIANDSCLTFWSENAKAYNAILQTALAARYDTSRFINTVTITATGIGTGEPFEWATSSSGSGLVRRNQFIAAGATNANLQAAITSEILADTVWHYTNIELCANPFQPVNPAAAVSVPITEGFIDLAASQYGTRLSIGNNGLRTPAAPDGAKWAPPSGNMYLLENYGLAKRAALGTKQYNQTASEAQMGGYGNLLAVLNAGAFTWKDILIELPDVEKKIKANLSNTQLKYYRDALKANE